MIPKRRRSCLTLVILSSLHHDTTIIPFVFCVSLSSPTKMCEDVWIQHKKLIPFFGHEAIHFLANFQHILFLPMILFAGRLGVQVIGFMGNIKFQPWTILGFGLHIFLHYSILSQTSYPIQVYFVASVQQGILSLQLLGNHYTRPWTKVHVATEGNHSVWQILCSQDFACHKWTRWYYGGLNFHYAHHLFPTLPREVFHIVTPEIKVRCIDSLSKTTRDSLHLYVDSPPKSFYP